MFWLISIYLFGLFPAYYFSVKFEARNEGSHEGFWAMVILWPLVIIIGGPIWLGMRVDEFTQKLIEHEKSERR